MEADELVAAFTAWAETRDDVVGAALIGSRARGAAGPGSDVDLLIVTTSLRGYVTDHQWTAAFGEVDGVTVERWGAVTSLRVRYAAGTEVEFGITTPEWTRTGPVEPGTARVVADGFRILSDRRGALRDLVASLDLDRAHAARSSRTIP